MDHLLATFTLTAAVGGVRFNVYTYVPEITEAEKIVDPLIHMHHSVEFFYIYGGTVKLSLADGKREIFLKKGDLCMIPAGMYHCAFSEYAERLCFEARIEADGTCKDAASNHYRGVIRRLAAMDTPLVISSSYIDAAMERYRTLSKSGKPFFETSGAAILLGVVTNALDNVKPASESHDQQSRSDIEADERKRIIERFIAEFFRCSNCLDMLAKALCLSERRTGSVVQEIMNKSFKQLIVEERMRVADILIKSGKYTLEQVSEIVGYKSYSGFYTAYRKYYGHTPENGGA